MAESNSISLSESLSKIRLQKNSTVVQVRRPATLLLAIESTLSQSTATTTTTGDDLPSSAYFLAILSTLTQLTSASIPTSGDQKDLLEALLYLLAIVSPRLDSTLLRSKSSLLPLLTTLFKAYEGQAPTTKSLLTISLALLSSLSLPQLQSAPSSSLLSTLLPLTVSPQPKVRRRAQEVILSLLSSPPSPAVTHPWKKVVGEYIIRTLEDAVRGAKRGGKKEKVDAKEGQEKTMGQGGGDESRAISMLVFIKNLDSCWESSLTPSLFPTLLSLLTLSSPHLTLSALTLLSHLFSSYTESDIEETLKALIKSRPRVDNNGEMGEGGEKLLGGWVEGVGEGVVALSRSSPDSALQQTTQLLPSLLSILPTSQTPLLRSTIAQAIEIMFKGTITDSSILVALSSSSGEVSEILKTIEGALKNPRFGAHSTPYLLSMVGALWRRLHFRPPLKVKKGVRGQTASSTLLLPIFKILASMREDNRFEWKRELDEVVAIVITIEGPSYVLNLLPLNLIPKPNQPASQNAKAWLLPLLKQSITNTSLSHFKEFFLPLSAELFARQEGAKEGGRGMEVKVWETLISQIWALLPGYCEYPVDFVKEVDGDFIGVLAGVVYSQPTLRPSVFKALSILLGTARTLANSTMPREILMEQFGVVEKEKGESMDLLKGLAGDVLGVCFNVYGKMGRGEGGYILTTVGDWLAALDTSGVRNVFERIVGLLGPAIKEDEEKEAAKKGHGAPKMDIDSDENTISASHALLDILITLVPYAKSNGIGKEFMEVVLKGEVFDSQDQGVQKKGYRILARLGEEGALGGREVGEMIEGIVERGAKVGGGAKRDRTLLLSTLVPLIPQNELHLIPSLIPEAVLGTKESNEKTREASYDLIVLMGKKMASGGTLDRSKIKGMEDGMEEEEVQGSVEEFVKMCSAGLAATNPHMISATITSLARIVFEFHSSLSTDTLTELLTTLIIFLSSANREIVRSAVGYVKVAIVSLPSSLVEPSLPTLIPALINWSHEHSNHFKVKIRHILERCIRKFGIEKVERECPEDDKKLIANIRKRQMRAKKKKAGQEDDEDAEMEDAEPAPKPQTSTRSAYDEVLYGSDSDISGSDDEERAGPAGNAVKNRKAKARKDKKAEGAFIREDDDEVLDLLDDKMMSRISAARPAASSNAPKKPLDSHFKTDSTGRMRITEDSDDEDGPIPTGAEAMGAYLEAMRGEDGHTTDAKGKAKFNKTQGKRGRGVDEDDDEPITKGIKELEVGGRRKKVKKESVKIGGEFKAKHAGGDVKKNGMSPYAYVPLQSVAGKNKSGQKLNITGKRKSAK